MIRHLDRPYITYSRIKTSTLTSKQNLIKLNQGSYIKNHKLY